jgi:hypothetical protein
MIEEIRNISTTKKIKKFSYLVGGILILISLYILWKGTSDFRILFGIGSGLILLGIIVPTILKPIYYVWMVFAAILGWFMTRVILSIVFYLIVTPIGLIAKIFRKKFLDLSFITDDNTYYNYRNDTVSDIEKQF